MNRRASLCLWTGAMFILLTACGVDASKLKASPEKYDGKEVKIEGIVREIRSIPVTKTFPGATVYKVEDKSGKDHAGWIWVLRGKDSENKILPQQNFPITVTGTFHTEEKVQGVNYSPLVEETEATQKVAEPAPGAVRF